MALPDPPISPNGSKLFAPVYDVSGTNTAAVLKAIKVTTLNSENTCHMAVATHAQNATWAAADPIVVVGGVEGTSILPLPVETAAAALTGTGIPIVGTDGSVARLLSVNASGHVNIADGGNTITVDGTVGVSGTVTVGTHAVTASGNFPVTHAGALAAGSNNIGDVDILTIAAGSNTIGGTRDSGWDQANAAVNRGLAQSVTATTEQTLLSADASNLYNITDIVLTWWSGSGAPGATRKLTVRLGTSGGGDPVFLTEYIPATSQQVGKTVIQFKEPVRSAVNKAITCQIDGALGTSGEYSIAVLAYKTSS